MTEPVSTDNPTRILLVDDEPQILDGLRFAMRRHRASWNVSVADGGEKALAEMKTASFDVVICDMRMPGMDGATLLKHIKEQYPDTIRIMLSAYSEPESLLRAVPVAHQYLAKPCKAADLQSCIERIRALRSLLNDVAARKIVGELDTIPSLPSLFLELAQAMENPTANAETVAFIIRRDAGMSAKILQLVNSAFFGLGHSITRIQDAVTYLGYNLVKNLVLSVGIFEKFDAHARDFSPERVQQHALQVGLVAGKLVESDADKDAVFMAAVLHNIGQLILATRLPEPFSASIRRAREQKAPQTDIETALLGTNHAVIGAYILGIWGLPTSIVEAVAYHHRPRPLQSKKLDVATALHVAISLCAEVDKEATPVCIAEATDLRFIEAAGLGASLAEWRKRAEKNRQERVTWTFEGWRKPLVPWASDLFSTR